MMPEISCSEASDPSSIETSRMVILTGKSVSGVLGVVQVVKVVQPGVEAGMATGTISGSADSIRDSLSFLFSKRTGLLKCCFENTSP